MSPLWQQLWPQQVAPASHACPLHGVTVHLPCWQKGAGAVQRVLQPPQFVGSFCASMSQATPLQQIIPGSHVAQLPPPELELLPELPPDPLEPLLDPLLEPPPEPLPEPLLDPLLEPDSRGASTEASPPPIGLVDPPQSSEAPRITVTVRRVACLM